MFLTLSYFSLFLFTKTKKGVEPTPEKKTRNRWYRTLGAIMLACIVLIAVYNRLLDETSIAAIKPVFLLESIALWAFGWSWGIKGTRCSRIPKRSGQRLEFSSAKGLTRTVVEARPIRTIQRWPFEDQSGVTTSTWSWTRARSFTLTAMGSPALAESTVSCSIWIEATV